MNISTASLLVQPTEFDKKKKDSKYFLGGLNPHKIVDEEDFEIQPTKVVWRDPFRMSVLDFQRNAFDKLAEILKILIKFVTEKGPLKDKCVSLKHEGSKTGPKEPLEDLHYQLHHIKHYKAEYETLLGQSDKQIDAIETKCVILIKARNLTAHQAYIKDYTPSDNPSASKSSKNRLGAGQFQLRDTRTFKHTNDVVVTCLEFAEKVLKGMEEAKQIVSGSDKRECPIIELHTKDKIN